MLFPSVSGKGIGVLDWEGKAMTALRDPSSSGYSQAINLFIQAIRIAKKMRPNVRWGYYALPYRTFWGMDDLWRKNNEGLKSILNETDIIFPSVYMLYTDGQVTSGKNRSYISNNISLALRLGQICNKPVMPFVTDRWQPSAKGFANKVIPKTDFVKYISEINKVVYNNHTISGIVWWGSPFYDYKMKNPVVRAEARSESEFVDIQDNLIINYCREIKALP
ncbi:hypothetical protein [Arachidicoccus sp.]|uniref:hypothetical protein n=1 Tax=Arachidicoccus sp. TaxID=1872624 RepID=UPI003D1C77DB